MTLTRRLAATALSSAVALSTLLVSVPAATAAGALSDRAPGSVPGSPGGITGSLPGIPGADPVDNLPTTFDLQAHRGGRGEHTEESRTAFETAIDLGVTTLELDIHMTEDGIPLVWHDPSIQDHKCTDTAPVTADDPEFPYVGKDVHDLTWDQIQTLTCDKVLDDFPDAAPATGNRILQLSDVFDIAERDPQVYFNIETKVEAEEPERSAAPQEYVDAILDAADAAGTTDRITVQSFDWSTLPLVRDRAPQVPLAALWDKSTWTPDSPYLGPVDYDAVDGDVLAGVEELGVEVASPAFDTSSSWVGGDLAGFIGRAHEAGVRVLPWTVNETADMAEYIDAGADGIITDYPSRLKELLDERGIAYRR